MRDFSQRATPTLEIIVSLGIKTKTKTKKHLEIKPFPRLLKKRSKYTC